MVGDPSLCEAVTRLPSRNFDLHGRGQDGQSEAEQPDHPASLGDSNAASHSDEVFGTHGYQFCKPDVSLMARAPIHDVRELIRPLKHEDDMAKKAKKAKKTAAATKKVAKKTTARKKK
jgi:hypothetical protein